LNPHYCRRVVSFPQSIISQLNYLKSLSFYTTITIILFIEGGFF